MKVAVLDLATVFAKLFKPAASSSSSPSYSPAPGAPLSKLQPLLTASASPSGAPSLPVRCTVLACAGGSSLTSVAAAARASPGGSSGSGAAALKPLASGSCASGSSSPRSAREPGAWAAPASKPLLFVTLPDIGEEGAPDADPREETALPRKGLSKRLVDHHFQAKNEYRLPAPFTKSVQEAIDNYSLASVSSLSPSGQTTPTDLNNSWSGIQSYTTGPSTERSSVYSWGDDEFDKANTQRVHQLFWDVDEMLFEGKASSQTENLKTECKDWTNRSLHLRILGKQLLFPKDEGFQHYQSRSSSSMYSKSVPSLSEINTSMKELCISGSKLVPAAFPVHKAFHPELSDLSLSESPGYSFLEEEIYDAEGKMEEYLAFDKKELDDEGLEQRNAQLAQKQIKYGIPPVSPNSCIKEAVIAEVFDQIWKNIIKILEELIRKYWESSITKNDKHTEKSKVIGNKLSYIPPSRVMLDIASVPPSRGSEVRSMSFGLHFGQSQAHRFSSSSHGNLNGVMTIQAKPLQQRHSSFIEKYEQEDKLQGVGSSINSSKNRVGRMTDSNISALPRVLPGSSKKIVGHRRLPSLAQDQLRLKTPNVYSDEVLRGTKLCTTLDRLPSPFTPAVRNKLPPINSDTIDQYLSVPGLRLSFHRGKHLHSRISSAVPHGLERRPHRERTVLIDQFSRPNTTHTFRSDTPQKRSVTSMDLANQLWMGQGIVTGAQFHARSFQKNPSLSRRRFQVA